MPLNSSRRSKLPESALGHSWKDLGHGIDALKRLVLKKAGGPHAVLAELSAKEEVGEEAVEYDIGQVETVSSQDVEAPVFMGPSCFHYVLG